MTNKQKNRIAIGLGVLAGAVAGYLFNSDKGREIRHDASIHAADAAKKTKAVVNDAMHNAEHEINRLTDEINKTYNRSKEYISESMEKASNKLGHAGSSFQEGVTHAIDNIRHKMDEVEKAYKKKSA